MKLKKKSQEVHKHLKLASELDAAVVARIKKLKRDGYELDFSKLVRGLLEHWLHNEKRLD